MKKTLSILMVVVLSFSMCACGKTKKEKEVVVETKVEEVLTEPIEVVEETKDEMPANLISNGDFTDGLGKWMTFFQGGDAKLIVNADGQMEVSVLKMGSVDYGVQAYLDEFALDQGCEYKIAFDISSSVDRDMEWRIQINGGDYHPYASEVLSLTSQTKHYESTFIMEETSDLAPRLCFNMGVRKEIKDIGEHIILIDNIELLLIDDSNNVQVATAPPNPNIILNQIGYKVNAVKSAVFRGEDIDTNFEVVNVDTGKSVFRGTVSGPMDNSNAGEKNAVGDFSQLKTPGTYKVIGEKCGDSYEFVIGDDVYDKAFNDVLKMLYLQRCGCKLTEEYAGEFAHSVCHSSKATIYGTSTKIDVSGGWHDAGDYGRYVVSGVKAVADLLLAYEENPTFFSDNVGILESGNNTPDILDEARYELEWLLKMQDSNSGGVYHKVTCESFPGVVWPQDETQELIISPISNCATGDLAAIMAMSARVYKNVDKDFASKCLSASKKAMTYLESHDNGIGFKNPRDIVTGEYGDTSDIDERFWALAELYKTTGDKKYQTQLKKNKVSSASNGLGWDNVRLYGTYAYLTSSKTDKTLVGDMKNSLNDAIQKVISIASNDGYYSTMKDNYNWGSNMGIANNGMLLIMANKIEPNANYMDLAQKQLDYLFGENANSYCFVTGYGTLSPTHTHHRPSQALGKTMPGMLVGGPNSDLQDPFAQATLQGVPKAKCYIDNEQSYSCNEITVYWNSPLIYLMSNLSE